MYILLRVKPLFDGNNEKEILKNVSIGKYDLNEPPLDKFSKNAKRFN